LKDGDIDGLVCKTHSTWLLAVKTMADTLAAAVEKRIDTGARLVERRTSDDPQSKRSCSRISKSGSRVTKITTTTNDNNDNDMSATVLEVSQIEKSFVPCRCFAARSEDRKAVRCMRCLAKMPLARARS